MAQRHMDRLTSFDTSFLANEKANGHMAIGALLMFEGSAPERGGLPRPHPQPRAPAAAPAPAPALPAARARHPVLGRLPATSTSTATCAASRCRRRGPRPSSASWSASCWRRRWTARKPLWELILVEGFEDERFAIVYKTHHAMADGISAVDIGMLLFDVEPKTEPAREEAPWTPAAHALAARPCVGRAGAGIARDAAPGSAAGCGARCASPARARRRAADGLAGLWEVTWNLARPAPKVPFNTAIGPRPQLRLGDLRPGRVQARQERPRRHRQRRHPGGRRRRPAALAAASATVAVDGLELKALVPVSIRTENEHGELGNKLTAMRGPLPVGIADPVERLRAVSAAMDALKASKQPLGAEAIWGLNDWFRDFAPPVLLAPTAAINFSTRLFNLLVTNFPGPAGPLLRARPRADRGLPDRLPRPAATRWRSRSSATTARSASGCSPIPTRCPTPSGSPTTSRAAVEELTRRRADSLSGQRWRRAGRR